MQIECPNNPKYPKGFHFKYLHKKFSVTAHIAQEWQVDSKGNFLKVLADCTDVIHKPDPQDVFICTTCGATAHVES